MNDLNRNRSDIVSVVTSPLGFFALSLLIVEGFLAIVLIFSNLEASNKFWGMCVGAALFFLVVLGVWLLVLIRPTNLTFGERSHLEHEKMQKDFGTQQEPISLKEIKEITKDSTIDK